MITTVSVWKHIHKTKPSVCGEKQTLCASRRPKLRRKWVLLTHFSGSVWTRPQATRTSVLAWPCRVKPLTWYGLSATTGFTWKVQKCCLSNIGPAVLCLQHMVKCHSCQHHVGCRANVLNSYYFLLGVGKIMDEQVGIMATH